MQIVLKVTVGVITVVETAKSVIVTVVMQKLVLSHLFVSCELFIKCNWFLLLINIRSTVWSEKHGLFIN